MTQIARITMTRPETTKFLGDLLISERFNSLGKHWASEVTLDANSTHVKRVDFMLFEPAGSLYVSDIEKGVFTSFEIKSCKEDFNSGHGLNFETEKNYIVMPMELYRQFTPAATGKSFEELPQLPKNVGVMTPIPRGKTECEEFENPTPLDKEGISWSLKVIVPCHQTRRKRSITELLFCMLRSGR